MIELLHGDCLELMRGMPDNSVDAVVTDPPYGLSFMGKKWDYDVPSVEIWAECLRVLKPGGHLLAFAGTRTQHRMAVRIEDAGFEIRDMIAWVYGSGFPKSHNLKDEWQGWGTALKPALEPITVARKPIVGTVAANVLEHGTGAINVDGCRVGTSKEVPASISKHQNGYSGGLKANEIPGIGGHDPNLGRWPANLIHDGSEEVLSAFPLTTTGVCNRWSGGGYSGGLRKRNEKEPAPNCGDTGSAARFFYCAKASKADRDEGLEGFEERPSTSLGDFAGTEFNAPKGAHNTRRNHHPTVKPTALMRYLVRLVTPPGGTVLDPFTGSGSTGKAAKLEGFSFIGMEREAEYIDIARARIDAAEVEPESNQLALEL